MVALVENVIGSALRAKHAPPAAWPTPEAMAQARAVLAGAVSTLEASGLRVEWTRWPHVRVVVGETLRGTWLDLCESLEADAYTRAATKLACSGWSPTRFTEARRLDETVEAIHALTLDCDDHGDWIRLAAVLAELGLAYVMHRTPTHAVNGACKWRAILPLVRPCEGDDLMRWRDAYNSARVVLGAVGACWFDPSCCNPSRLWYGPIAIADAAPREVITRVGKALDLMALADSVKAMTATAPAPSLPIATPGKRLTVAAPKMSARDRAERWLDRVEGAVEGQGGDHATYRVACKMVKDFDLSDADALAALERWNQKCNPRWSTADLEAKIRSARKNGTHTPGEALDEEAAALGEECATWVPPEAVPVRVDEKGDPVKTRDSIKWALVTEKGAPVNCRENLEAMFAHYGVTCRYNLMKHEDEYDLRSYRGAADKRANAGFAQIRELARKHGLSAGEPLNDQLEAIVADNAYHPVADFIRSAPWDGVDRIDELFGSLTLACEPDRVGLMRRLFVAWAATAARAALVPSSSTVGVAAQLVLVLQGPQGVQKTRWVQSLVPKGQEWVREGVMLDPSQRDSVQQATNVWIVELGELDATFRKADIAALKAHLTSRSDTYRAAYAHKADTRARRTVYAATVNERGVLHDETGSRRFAVIAISECNSSHGVDLQQFWAQMASLPESACFLAQADEKALLENNKQHEATDPLAELCMLRWEVDTDLVPTWQTLRDVLEGIDADRQWTTSDSRAIGKVLRERMQCAMRVSRGVRQFALRRCL